ncbi:MAG TPA: hypothetical protein VE568_07000 [Rubrobacter sp.]|jgi:hypothetical protein|nr:hypothetical protein [Rubrobacter sp.]
MFDRALLASRLVILVANLASVVLALGAINQAAPRLLVVVSLNDLKDKVARVVPQVLVIEVF